MAAKTAHALARAHDAALARGDLEAAELFSESAARFALFYATGRPMVLAPERKPRKRRARARKRSPASSHDLAATSRARKENAALSAFLAFAAVLALCALFLSHHAPRADILTDRNEPLTPSAHTAKNGEH